MGYVVVVLGSTGSIGQNTLNIAASKGLEIEALACGNNISLLNEQIKKFNPRFVCVASNELKDKVRGISSHNIYVSQEGLEDMLSKSKSELVVNAIVGFAGLRASLASQKLGKKLALANKESLVVAGKFISRKNLAAIDSEHCGLWFLQNDKSEIDSLIITASGGAFYRTELSQLATATPQMALKHPNWAMGAKITIDSATMANKLFEILEAFWLFGTDKIDAIIEPSSLIHALISFKDGSLSAHLSTPDMKLAIAHALASLSGDKSLANNSVAKLDWHKLPLFEFKSIDLDRYPIFGLKDELLANPDLGVVINAANEVAVDKFLNKQCGFLDISRAVLAGAREFKGLKISSQDEIFKLDKQAREFALKELNAKV